ncbi:hypothetical protein DPMN_003945 [Dreissena polymorpha]|uniref:Uncharacterized protein n=1 Tax=Dreissena polymorpha TaxID=45954 RepID=A0A9D4RV87_DREPO|nr:hypothetical protein DPMN_003945 [Dreissena polymorpha]
MGSGSIHVNGGSGGGGGGYIAIYHTSGFVDTRRITSYGGSNGGDNGAAGVIYLSQNGKTKVKCLYLKYL